MQFIWHVTSFGKIRSKMITLKEKEADFRMKLKQILIDERYSSFIGEEKREKLEKYLTNDWQYYTEPKYDEEALAVLEESIFLFYEICSGAPFRGLKRILDYQIEILHSNFPL